MFTGVLQGHSELPRERAVEAPSALRSVVHGAFGVAAAMGDSLLHLVRPHQASGSSTSSMARASPDDEGGIFSDILTKPAHQDAELKAFFLGEKRGWGGGGSERERKIKGRGRSVCE